MSDEDDYGGMDDEELMLIAAEAEGIASSPLHFATEFPDPRASKRRRLNSYGDANSWEGEGHGSDHDSVELTLPSSPTTALQDVEHNRGPLRDKPKSKYRIHIPKHADLPQDTFYTQLPPGSQSPYRIRGPYWQKPKPESPQELQPLNRQVSSMAHGNHHNAATRGQPSAANYISTPQSTSVTSHTRLPRKIEASGSARAVEIVNSLPPQAPTRFERDFEEAMLLSCQDLDPQYVTSPAIRSDQQPRLVAPLTNLRQTTLFGEPSQIEASQTQTQSVRKPNWPAADRDEAPTHHKLNRDALQTWVYPTNLGTIRDYQFSIVATGLYHNLLVALPTGLGKTFIAATIMLNWFRWTKDAQIIFVAPTKPLVSQQVEACFKIVGIPSSETTMLTGQVAPDIREQEWNAKRVFFMTPQTLINDLKKGIADPKRIVLLVVDEAHRATGSYAYVEVVKFLRRFNSSFRVLALTATPGSSVEAVQEVIDGLGISRVEIRTEQSLDIRQYVHSKDVESILFDYSDDMVMVMDLFSKTLQPLLNQLRQQNAYWRADPMEMTPYALTQAMRNWASSDAGKKASQGLKGMVNGICSLLASLAHAIVLLKFHGIGPFFRKLTDFRQETIDGNSKNQSRKQVVNDENFKEMMIMVQEWVNKPDFVGHPKLEYLQTVVLNHFLDAGEGRGTKTRIMVFCQFRDSAEELVRVLNRNGDMVRAHVFVGQANSKGSDGMDQKKQLSIIEKFKDGFYNTLVATSIGEEGLDIGEVDLIVCYDTSASPIRMLQRMGRTGRKRAGNIHVLLIKGKEEQDFAKAKDNYQTMQKMIAEGRRFKYHQDLAPRIVPKGIEPAVDKRCIDIPIENTQAPLPEPKRGRGRAPKRPPKKFHMPDGVRTGFSKASRLDNYESNDDNDVIELDKEITCQKPHKRVHEAIIEVVPVPSLESVLLSAEEEQDLIRTYQDVGGVTPQYVNPPRLEAFPHLQRTLRRTEHVPHGLATKRMVKMLATMHAVTEERYKRYADIALNLNNTDSENDDDPFDTGSLADFIDDDEHDAPFLEPESLLLGSSPPSKLPSREEVGNLFYDPKTTYVRETQSEDELPNLSQLIGKGKGQSKDASVSIESGGEEGTDDEELHGTAKRGVRRFVVDDSDDE